MSIKKYSQPTYRQPSAYREDYECKCRVKKQRCIRWTINAHLQDWFSINTEILVINKL